MSCSPFKESQPTSWLTLWKRFFKKVVSKALCDLLALVGNLMNRSVYFQPNACTAWLESLISGGTLLAYCYSTILGLNDHGYVHRVEETFRTVSPHRWLHGESCAPIEALTGHGGSYRECIHWSRSSHCTDVHDDDLQVYQAGLLKELVCDEGLTNDV